MKKLTLTLSALLLLSMSSVVILGAKPSAERKVDLMVNYYTSAADKQFKNGIEKHFNKVPKKSEIALESTDESPHRLHLNMKIIKHNLKEGNVPTDYEASGKGSLFINGNEYTYEFSDLIYVEENHNGNYFYSGSLEGTVKTEEGEVPAVFTITTIPDEDKTLVTIGVDDVLGDEPTALAFGEVFEEYTEWQNRKFEE